MTDPIAAVDEQMRRAIVRGFTRSDLLFLGELCDVTPAATRLGFVAPVAISRAVHDATISLAATLGVTSAQATRKLLLSLFNLVKDREFTRDEKAIFTSPGHPSEMFVHAAATDAGAWFLTVYAVGETPALV